MKNKIAGAVAAIGGLCALCCVLPIAGFFGLGALEAFFCDTPWAVHVGIGTMTISLGYLAYKYRKGFCATKPYAATCTLGCGCKWDRQSTHD